MEIKMYFYLKYILFLKYLVEVYKYVIIQKNLFAKIIILILIIKFFNFIIIIYFIRNL